MNVEHLMKLASRRARVLVVGDVMLDRYTHGHPDRVSPEAPVLVLQARNQEVRLGGAASVAAIASGLGAEVALAGVVGDDSAAVEVRTSLQNLGIGQDLIYVDRNRPTTVKQRILAGPHSRSPQQIVRVDHESTLPISSMLEERITEVLLPYVRDCDVVLVADYGKGFCTPRLLSELVRQARRFNIPVLVDPAHGVEFSRYSGATLVKPNRAEAVLASGLPIKSLCEAMRAAAKLREAADAGAAVVTLDRDGLVLAERGNSARWFGTRERAICDITGAGDTSLAVLGLGAAAGLAWEHTAEIALVAAGLQVERLGVSLVRWDEILADSLLHAPTLKIVTLEHMLALAVGYRRQKRRIVFTNGCFDLLHVGHIHCLQEAAALGDVLLVAVNSDETVRRLKGPPRPVISAQHRAAVVAALGCVNHVLIFDEETPHRLLEALRPDVLAKGGTYSHDEVVGHAVVEAYGGQVRALGLVEGVSTTDIVSKVQTPEAVAAGV
jgi:D-beta-D-heptose 7-phosphate kinase/D-beta-D-heptose 1-phosphate adenosyltransferase